MFAVHMLLEGFPAARWWLALVEPRLYTEARRLLVIEGTMRVA